MAEATLDVSELASPKLGGIAEQASRPNAPDRGKLRVFISYSRDDLYFADQLDEALYACGIECLVDRHGISGGEDWRRRLGNLISEADTIVFVLSPSAARSEVCAWEVEEAARLSKRILPVICRPLEGVDPPPRLRELNYVFFYAEPRVPGSGFGAGLARLVAALNTDFDWLREHTRYLQLAIEWDASGRSANRLLSGIDVLEAKAWATHRPKSAPEPTALQLDFICASEEEPEAELGEQRKQLDAGAPAQAEGETALHQAEEALNAAAALFVSHVHEDRGAAMAITEELERRGIRCWIAPRDVNPGMPFDDEIADALDASQAVLLIFSDRCNGSDYIRREVTVAGESRKLIMPFRIENAVPKRGLRVRLADLHCIDAFVVGGRENDETEMKNARARAIDDVVRTLKPLQDKQT